MSIRDEKSPLRLDHVAVWVDDMEATVNFLTDVVGWRRHPMLVEVSEDDPTVGGMQAVFIDANGLWLELILPTSPGPGMEILKEVGKGAVVELCFEPSNYQTVLEDMKDKGIPMFNMDGSPLGEDGGLISEGVLGMEHTHDTGQRIAYWSKEMSQGTTVEMYELLKDDDTNLLNIRDNQWTHEVTSRVGPRLDRVAIVVENIETTASFYTDVMGLRRHPMKNDIDGDINDNTGGMKMMFIDANGVWLVLVQPTGPGPLMDLLQEKGDGYIAELIAEVDDLGVYYDQLKAKGIELLDINGAPFKNNEKGFVLEPFGDRAAYLPSNMACGMVIEIYQRGPRDTSLIHRRDDSWK